METFNNVSKTSLLWILCNRINLFNATGSIIDFIQPDQLFLCNRIDFMQPDQFSFNFFYATGSAFFYANRSILCNRIKLFFNFFYETGLTFFMQLDQLFFQLFYATGSILYNQIKCFHATGSNPDNRISIGYYWESLRH